MAYCSVYEDIVFIEGQTEYLEHKGKIKYQNWGFGYNQQLKNINKVKHQFAEKAKRVGANAVINFEYGQKSASFFKSWLRLLDDNVEWYGSGELVVISETEKERIMDKIKNN